MTITRRWQAGAEIDTTNSANIEFDVVSGSFNESATQKKTGSYSYVFANHNDYALVYVPATRQLRLGEHTRSQLGGTNGSQLLSLLTSGGTRLIEVVVTSEGVLQLFVGGSAQDTYTGINNTAFEHYGLDVKVHSSAGWAVFYLDGVEVMRVEGNTGDADIERVVIGNYAPISSSLYNFAAPVYVDDIYLDDTTGEGAAAPPPSYQFEFLRPTDNGNYSNMTGSDGNKVNNYLLTQEALNDGDATFVYTEAADDEDTYTMADFTIPVGFAVTAVIPTAICKKSSAADIKIAPMIRENSTDWTGTAVATPTSYGNVLYERRTTAPDGGAWGQTEINGMEVGFISGGTFA